MSDQGVTLVDMQRLTQRPSYLVRVVVNLGIVIAAASGVLLVLALPFAGFLGLFGLVIAGYYVLMLLVLTAPLVLAVAAIPEGWSRHAQRVTAVAVAAVVVAGASALTAAWLGDDVAECTAYGAAVGLVVGALAWLPRST